MSCSPASSASGRCGWRYRKKGGTASVPPFPYSRKYYCDFFSGSWVAPDGELPPLAPLEDGLLAPAEPEAEPLAPPEAAPEPEDESLGASDDELGELLLLDEELGALGVVAELPPEGELEDELEPELDGGVDGVVALPLVLPLVLLLPLDLPVPLSWPQAARPNARATATASVESFMCPPWLDTERKQQRTGRA